MTIFRNYYKSKFTTEELIKDLGIHCEEAVRSTLKKDIDDNEKKRIIYFYKLLKNSSLVDQNEDSIKIYKFYFTQAIHLVKIPDYLSRFPQETVI